MGWQERGGGVVSPANMRCDATAGVCGGRRGLLGWCSVEWEACWVFASRRGVVWCGVVWRGARQRAMTVYLDGVLDSAMLGCFVLLTEWPSGCE